MQGDDAVFVEIEEKGSTKQRYDRKERGSQELGSSPAKQHNAAFSPCSWCTKARSTMFTYIHPGKERAECQFRSKVTAVPPSSGRQRKSE